MDTIFNQFLCGSERYVGTLFRTQHRMFHYSITFYYRIRLCLNTRNRCHLTRYKKRSLSVWHQFIEHTVTLNTPVYGIKKTF